MILGTLSLAMLIFGASCAYRTEKAVERGRVVPAIQLYSGGLLIIGGLSLIGACLGLALG